jgi:hypothetical protein
MTVEIFAHPFPSGEGIYCAIVLEMPFISLVFSVLPWLRVLVFVACDEDIQVYC